MNIQAFKQTSIKKISRKQKRGLPSNSGALNMPARSSSSPWRLPDGFQWLPGFPQGKVSGVLFISARWETKSLRRSETRLYHLYHNKDFDLSATYKAYHVRIYRTLNLTFVSVPKYDKFLKSYTALMKCVQFMPTWFPSSISHVHKLAITTANGLSIKVDVPCVKSTSFYFYTN